MNAAVGKLLPFSGSSFVLQLKNIEYHPPAEDSWFLHQKTINRWPAEHQQRLVLTFSGRMRVFVL